MNVFERIDHLIQREREIAHKAAQDPESEIAIAQINVDKLIAAGFPEREIDVHHYLLLDRLRVMMHLDIRPSYYEKAEDELINIVKRSDLNFAISIMAHFPDGKSVEISGPLSKSFWT